MKISGIQRLNYPKMSNSVKDLTVSAENVEKSGQTDLHNVPFYGLPVERIAGKGVEAVQNLVSEIVTKNLDSTYAISRVKHGKDALRFEIGEEIEGFRGLFRTKALAVKYSGEDNIYLLSNTQNNLTGNISVFDKELNEIKKFSTDDIIALKEYKYTPEAFHGYLRHGRVRGLLSREELDNFIANIDEMFVMDNKAYTTEKPTKLYRALQQDLSSEDIEQLSRTGGIFTEKSFASTSTDLSVAKRFNGGSPILEINVPQGAKYLDMDKLFNIQMRRWREDEYLLNRNSKFKVTGFDAENNIIKVDYLNV